MKYALQWVVGSALILALSGCWILDLDKPPNIEFTYVPPIGSTSHLRGRVEGVIPPLHRVAVYIQVDGTWWTKPYWDAPLTPVDFLTATWSCDIATGGDDTTAARIAAFLVPAGYNPPVLDQAPALPNELYNNAVAHVEVRR